MKSEKKLMGSFCNDIIFSIGPEDNLGKFLTKTMNCFKLIPNLFDLTHCSRSYKFKKSSIGNVQKITIFYTAAPNLCMKLFIKYLLVISNYNLIPYRI